MKSLTSSFYYDTSIFEQFPPADGGHDGWRGVVCGICQRAFSTKFNLRRHMVVHGQNQRVLQSRRGRAPRPHSMMADVCPVCNRGFSKKGNLERHMLLHRSQRTVHQCPLCPSKHSWPGNLQTHMRVAHGVRPQRKIR